MQMLTEPGIVLDTLQFGMLYFNKQLIELRERVMFSSDEQPLLYFDFFRTGKRKVEPSTNLYPFFRYQSQYIGSFPLCTYFMEHYDVYENDPMRFFDSLHSEEFHTFCLKYYFQKILDSQQLDSLRKGDLEVCLKALSYLQEDDRKQSYYIEFLCNFDELVSELIQFLQRCYKKMVAFHEVYVPSVLEQVNACIETDAHLIKRMGSFPEQSDLDDNFYTIHLMDHQMIHFMRLPDKKYLIFMCASSKKALSHWGESSKINLHTFGEDFGNELSYEIIQTMRTGEYTASQLSNVLYSSRSTVDRALRSLKKNQVIRVTRKIGTEVYYSLDAKYFLTLKAKILRDINDILEDIYIGASKF